MTKSIAYCSCDPGAKGSFCVLDPTTKKVAFMPTTTKPIDLVGWFYLIQKEVDLKVILIEDVHSIFGTSAKSNFNFGFNTGLVHGIARSTGVSVDLVTPKIWQKYIGVKTKGKLIKKEVADICERLYPQVNVRGPRGGLLDGLSDSLMIAHFAAHKYR